LADLVELVGIKENVGKKFVCVSRCGGGGESLKYKLNKMLLCRLYIFSYISHFHAFDFYFIFLFFFRISMMIHFDNYLHQEI
jgi:hypothetical protein